MEIYISIDGVLRNLIQKFEYHYTDYFLNREPETEAVDISDIVEGEEVEISEKKVEFEYGIEGEVKNDNLLDVFKFQSVEEYENFTFIEYPIEIYGHAGLNSSTSISDFNKFVFDNKEHNITLVGVDEFGKAKPSTLFFLSKSGCLANNINFIKSSELESVWEKCDIWVTDNEKIVKSCPKDKKSVKFNTNYNKHFTNPVEIDKLDDINKLIK